MGYGVALDSIFLQDVFDSGLFQVFQVVFCVLRYVMFFIHTPLQLSGDFSTSRYKLGSKGSPKWQVYEVAFGLNILHVCSGCLFCWLNDLDVSGAKLYNEQL